jgi:hypothetical protein
VTNNNKQSISRNDLSNELEVFIDSGVSAVASSADYRCIPSVCKVMACEINLHQPRLRVFFNAAHAADLLLDIKKTGVIAVAICDPTTHKTIQLKGNNATQSSVTESDLDRIRTNIRLFTKKITLMGFDETYCVSAFDMDWDFNEQDIASVSFTPNILYEQSPGPQAGKLLEFAN